jgi:integrase
MKLSKEGAAELVLPVGKSDHIEWDDDLPGFGIRLRGKTKSWIVQYRVGIQQRRESLGDIRKVKIEDARKIARQRFAQAELGVDPAAERAKSRAAAAASKWTLAAVVERYLAAKKSQLRPSTYKHAERYFAVQWKPLRNRAIDTIRRADVAATLQDVVRNHGRTSAARARGNLSALFSWAMKEGLCEGNPVIATNDPAEGIEPRDRVLTDGELATIWRACGDDDFSRIVKLLILTGCRREEIGGLLWSEIDPDTGVVTIPGERTKNHRTLVLPLPRVAIDLLRSAPRRDERIYVFGNRGGAFSAWSYSTLALNARIAAAEGKSLAHWTLHDLRRTMRTGLGRLRVAPHVAELVINHTKRGVEATYDRYSYEREIKDALALWADHVAGLVAGRTAKVVPLRA